MARVAIIFDNFGPYHLARLGAAARVCDLLAVEVHDHCLAHGWPRENGVIPFQSVTLANHGGGNRLGSRVLFSRLQTVFSEFKPEVVFLPGWSCAASFVAQRWCSLHSVPSVVMSESNSWDEQRTSWKEWIKQRVARMSSAALVGGTTHKDYLTELGMPPERVFLGYDTVDNDYFARMAAEVRRQPSRLKTQNGLPETKFFLASARFVEKKNLPSLIRAYGRYREMASSNSHGKQSAEIWHLVVLGDGPLKPDLCRQISSLGLQEVVHLPGFKNYDELPIYYASADAFVHASTTEQWGLVVNEAMASGLPVLVSTRCGCATDLVKPGQNGFTFNAREPEEIAQLMLKMAGLEARERDQLGQAARTTISRWSSARFAEGVDAAVAEAREVGARRISIFDKILLQLLAFSSQ